DVAAIHNMSENRMGVGIPEHWVHAAYRLETWAHVYASRNAPSQAGGSSQPSAAPSTSTGARNASSQAAGSSQPSATPSTASQGPS
ncbi:hypothetical protein Tco_0584896, partial [Tanacetum coccineum]